MVITGENLPGHELNELYNEFPANNLNIRIDFEDRGTGLKYILSDGGEKSEEYAYDVKSRSELEKKRYLKRYARLALYNYMSKRLKVTLPWGALTGIRPMKLYYQNENNAEDFLVRQMGVSPGKFKILEEIHEAQKPYYEADERNFALYIGIPFCPTRCTYCSFISEKIGKSTDIGGYVNALQKEITETKELVHKLRSVYIGGGTPVSLDLKNLEKVLKAAGKVDCEYTVEAGRADCINRDVLKLLKDYGVNRVCVNPQTFNDGTLKLIGRNHTGRDAVDKYYMAREYGFAINMDLIAGLPLETFEIFEKSLETAIMLRPENITVHTLCLKKGSKLRELCSRLPEGEVEKMVDFSFLKLREAGYRPYYIYRQKYMAGNLENTGYSLPGKECLYNIDVMEETAQNPACGANAVSKRIYLNENRIERIGAPKDVQTYIRKVDKLMEEKRELFRLF